MPFIKKMPANFSTSLLKMPLNCPSLHSGQLRVKKVMAPSKYSFKMAHKVICPQEKKSPALSKLAVH